MLRRLTKVAKKYTFTPLFFYNKHFESKNKQYAYVAAYLKCIHIFAKIVRHVGSHLGFLGPHHDSSQSPSIFLHLIYVSNHLWNNFLWTSHAHRHPLRDCIKTRIWQNLNKSIVVSRFFMYYTFAKSQGSCLNTQGLAWRT